MSAHTHRTLVDGCYRCDLNKAEMPGPHECDALDVDWGNCELCGALHTFCSTCGEVRDDCTPAL